MSLYGTKTDTIKVSDNAQIRIYAKNDQRWGFMDTIVNGERIVRYSGTHQCTDDVLLELIRSMRESDQ